MLDGDAFLALLGFVFISLVFLMFFIAFFLVAGYIVAWMGFNGLAWWVITFVIFVFIASFYSMINRIGR